MTPADMPLDRLVDDLRAMTPGDRQAVLGRLTVAQRGRVRALLRAPSVPSSPYAPDIAERIAAVSDDPRTTPATREALARAVRRPPADPVPMPPQSLLDRIVGRIGTR